MMNKIFKDLQENIRNIYSGSNIITINKFFHHSLHFPEMAVIYTNYKGNIEKIKVALFDNIIQNEINKSGNTSKKRYESFDFNDPLINEFFGDAFNDEKIYQDKDVLTLFNVAQKFELKKFQKQVQETGQVLQPEDISMSSALRAIIDIATNSEKYAYLSTIMKDSGFQIDKFIKDYNQGKPKIKKIINEYCINLNNKAKEGKLLKVLCRDLEIEQLLNVLKKAVKNNPVLIGKAGVGKTAIVEGLAKKIVEGDIPEKLKNAVIYELRVMDMVKGTSFRGQFEQKMSDLLEEFKDLEESGALPVLFIDELHTIIGAGSSGQGGLDFSNIIKPALARGELRTIGATTTDEWYSFIKENPALDRRFVSITVSEPSTEETFNIISGSIEFYEKSHNVTYEKGTIERAIELTEQFIPDKARPDKVFDLVDYSGAMCSVKNKKIVTIEDIECAISINKNIELDAIVGSRKVNIEPFAPKIKNLIFGQDTVVEKVCKTIEKAIAGLNSKEKPYGAFLFTGPTGTGKTELAKQISKLMRANFIRIDMSEYKESHTISKLIGSPAGYVGYSDASFLLKQINEKPRTVLLLDEIEKAHPDVVKLFLQVMDYGKLTDSHGREISFCQTLILMSSNANIFSSHKTIGFKNETKVIYNNQIESIFPPEFLGRLSCGGPLQFNPINQESMEKILEKFIHEIQIDRLNKLNIKLEIENNAKKKLIQLGLSKQLGARPVRDFIESEILEKITDLILFGELKQNTKERIVRVELSSDDNIILSLK